MTTIDPGLAGGRWGAPTTRLPIRGVVQIVVIVWVYIIYGGFRNLATGPTAVSTRNAETIADAERFLHLDVERSVQAFAVQYAWVVKLCSLCYSATHLVVLVIVLILLYRRAPARYLVWRDAFLVLLGMALLAFAVFPTTPPWLMPSSYGFVDTAHLFAGGRGAVPVTLAAHVGPTAGDLWRFSNPFAAMPSLHVTWAVWAGVAAWPVVRRRSVKVLLASYAPAMTLSVIVTANHWVLDSVVGAVMLAAAVGISHAINELRWRRIRRALERR